MSQEQLRIVADVNIRRVVFADLDGTLLDQNTCDWQPAVPVLERLRHLGIPVILVSGKTLPEFDNVGIAAVTGLSLAEAELANRRRASKPIPWNDTDARLHEFVAAAEARGLYRTRGGRCVHRMGSADKADAVSRLCDACREKLPHAFVESIGLREYAHAIMLTLEGMPAICIHSLLGTPNDYEGLARTGRYRSINRRGWLREVLEAVLDDSASLQCQALHRPTSLLKPRRKQKAFHPNAIRFAMRLRHAIFGIWRHSIDRGQNILCASNVTSEPREVELENINLVSTEGWSALINGEAIAQGQVAIRCEPCQTVWFSNR